MFVDEGVGEEVAVRELPRVEEGASTGDWLLESILLSFFAGDNAFAPWSDVSSPQPNNMTIQRLAERRAQTARHLGIRIRLKFSVVAKVLSSKAAYQAEDEPSAKLARQ